MVKDSALPISLKKKRKAEEETDPQDGFQINLKIEKIVSMDATSSDTIRHIKTKLSAKEGLSVNDQELFFEGNHLKYNNKTLSAYNIPPNSMINLLIGGIMHIFVKIHSTGKTVKLEVNDKYTIKNVKARIEAMEKLPQNRQGLIYMGNLLEDSSSLIDCDIRNGSTLQMILSPEYKLHVSIRTMNTKQIRLEARSWYTIRDVKQIFEGMSDSKATKQKLFYNGKELEDNLTLSECKISDQSILQLRVGIQLFVKIWDGKSITVMIDKYDLVDLVIRKIEEKMSVNLHQSTLSYAGRSLRREEALADYKIESESTVHLQMRSCGECRGKNIVG